MTLVTVNELKEYLPAVACFAVALLLAGCASLMPTQTIDGIAVYVAADAAVEQYCRSRGQREQLHPAGCYISAERTIMVKGPGLTPYGARSASDVEATIAHELRHARGEQHIGPCNVVVGMPDGLRPAPDWSPCVWYRVAK